MMLAVLKEWKDRVTSIWQPDLQSGDSEYTKLEYGMEHHLRTSLTPSPFHYGEEARYKSASYH